MMEIFLRLLPEPLWSWFTDERKMWLAIVVAGGILGASIANGYSTYQVTRGCYDQLYHATVQDKAQTAIPSIPAPVKE